MARALPDLSTLGVFDDRLREVASERGPVEDALARASVLLEAADATDRARLLGYAGNAERMLGRPARAIELFEEALSLCESARDALGRVVALIRLGEAHRCANDAATSELLLREALREIETDGELSDLRDFALQHLGKCLVEQGRRDEAVRYLEEALALRTAKGDDALLASTTTALAWAREPLRAT